MLNPIGSSLTRKEALQKVTGEPVFVGDFLLANCLEGKILRSPHPHAKIVHIDSSRAKRLTGVRTVITADDLPDRRFGNGVSDQPVLAREKVCFAGERVAAVAAIDEDTALEALSLIKVDYEELPCVNDVLKAMQKGAPILHEQRNIYAKNHSLKEIPGLEMANIVDHVTYSVGDIDAGFAQADQVLEHTFSTQSVHQGYMESHYSAAAIDQAGIVRFWTNNKGPFQLRTELSEILDIPMSLIEVNYAQIGGDFGGKGMMMDEPICYYLAKACQQPVRIIMTDLEELSAANPRHAAIVTIKSGLRSDGSLLARKATVIFDAGAYAGANSHPIVAGLRRSLGAYRIPNTLIDGYAVYTNSIPAGHCRAPGDPQVFYAVESHTDILAETVGLDPYSFRRLNLLRSGDCSPSGLEWQGINASEVLDTAITHSHWSKNKNRDIGIGMAITERATGLGGSAAVVMIHADGSVSIVSGATDPGTGSQTVLRQIAAQVLEVPFTRVKFSGGSTSLAPYDSGSGSSRVTHVTGQAVRVAALDALKQVKKLAANHFKKDKKDIRYSNGCFVDLENNELTLQQVLEKAGRGKNVITGRGSYVAEIGESTCFSAQVAEVSVDRETGQVSVLRVVAANDIGKALNPLAVQSQVEGAVVQGVGFALNEELKQKEGKLILQGLADYKMATALDAPVVESHLVEGAEGPGPFGAKAIGEQGIAATAPAIANAIYNAVGVRIFDLPITPEKVVQALREKKEMGEKDAI